MKELLILVVVFLFAGIVGAQNPIVPYFNRTEIQPDSSYYPIGTPIKMRMMSKSTGQLVWVDATVAGYFIAHDGSMPPEYDFVATVDGLTGHYQFPIKDNLGISFMPAIVQRSEDELIGLANP